MKSFTIAAISALLSTGINAVPLNKRDIVWVTHTDIDTVVVPVVETVWVNGPDATLQHQHHHHTHHTVHVTSTVHVTPAGYTSTAAPASTSVYLAPTTSSSSVYVAPTTSSSSVYVAPTTSSSSVYVAPTTSSTSVYVAPTSSPAPYTPPSPTSSQAPATSASAPGAANTGDLTYYATGLGSCGTTSTDEDAIVALAADMMTPEDGANPNDNPLCGRQISITWGGITKTATIVDTCPGCSGAGLDLSPSLFSEFASQSVGVLKGATWSFS